VRGDQEFTHACSGGFSYLRRKLDIPEAFFSDPSIPFPD